VKELAINIEKTKKILVNFIKKEFKNTGFNRAILGISGGVDSALSAALCCEALGRESVIGLILPYGKKSADIRLAKQIVKILKIKYELIDISPMIDPYFKRFTGSDKVRRGNKMARERMSILYDQSKRFNALVIGTGNKTESLLGYCTIFGDAACAINPLSSLYKFQVLQLAAAMGIPKEIIQRKPSAGLWTGQTDEAELGYSYSDMDRLLHYMVDEKLDKTKLISMGFKKKFIEDIASRMAKNRFKFQPPRTIEL